MQNGVVRSDWVRLGSVRFATSMRTLNVGGSAGQPPRVFLTRMLGIRAAHLRPFSFSSSHQRPHPAPRTQSLSLSFSRRLGYRFSLNRHLVFSLHDRSVSRDSRVHMLLASESGLRQSLLLSRLIDHEYQVFVAFPAFPAIDSNGAPRRRVASSIPRSRSRQRRRPERRKEIKGRPKVKSRWKRGGVERWFPHRPEDVPMSRGRQEGSLPR